VANVTKTTPAAFFRLREVFSTILHRKKSDLHKISPNVFFLARKHLLFFFWKRNRHKRLGEDLGKVSWECVGRLCKAPNVEHLRPSVAYMTSSVIAPLSTRFDSLFYFLQTYVGDSTGCSLQQITYILRSQWKLPLNEKEMILPVVAAVSGPLNFSPTFA